MGVICRTKFCSTQKTWVGEIQGKRITTRNEISKHLKKSSDEISLSKYYTHINFPKKKILNFKMLCSSPGKVRLFPPPQYNTEHMHDFIIFLYT